MTEAIYQKRRQRVFFVLSGLFLGTLAMLNILGISRFLDLVVFAVRNADSHDGGGGRIALSGDVYVH
jgi:hypothetical protein